MAEEQKQAQSRGGRAPATEKAVQVRAFQGYEAERQRVAMPADGRFALTTGDDAKVRKWWLTEDGPQQGAVVCSAKPTERSLAGGGFVGLAVTSDGSFAAAGHVGGTIHLIDLCAGRELLEWRGHNRVAGTLAFLYGRRELLSAGDDGWLRRWSTFTGGRMSQCKVSFGDLNGVAASTDGNRIVGA